MTPVRRVRGIVAVLATLAAATLATTAQDQAHAATDNGAGASAARTTLRLHFTGCDRCSVQLQHAVNGKPHVWTSKAQRIGSDHTAVFHLPTSRTQGLSFVLRAPWEGNTGAVSNIVTRYAGYHIDSVVDRDAARHAQKAQGCWAGTGLDRVRLDFHVARVDAKTLDGRATQIPLVYATHTMSSWKPTVTTFKGTIGNQDAFYCTRPPMTKLTLTAADCAGCQVGVMNGALRPENTWSLPPRTMTDGALTVRVPRNLTRGISTTVYGPWEGATGYTTVVAWRYGGKQVGDRVGFKAARAAHRGSPCWGGTDEKALTVALTIRKVRTDGTTGPTNGTIAFARVTQPWLRPMERTDHGILGSQEVITCRK
ncbi:MAG TPA: hypothetical protein VFI21_01105 [Nocardioides sp.]|jgi:hypothetical protein|nr:hypothetical protein [Nocardioides sp.]